MENKLYKAFFRWVPVHYFLIFMITMATILMFSCRLCLSVAMVAMSSRQAESNEAHPANVTERCFALNQSTFINDTEVFTAPMVKEFDWSNKQQSMILGSYFYGFIATQIIGGMMANLWSLKWTMTISIAASAFLTLLSPLAARAGLVPFVILRVVLGLFSGTVLASSYCFTGRWVPLGSRAATASLIDVGSNIGTILSIAISGYLSRLEPNDGGWPYIFYFFGVLSFLWVPFWLLAFYDYPSEHPGISAKELKYLTEEIQESTKSTRAVSSIPWRAILLSIPMWALMMANFGHNWVVDLLQLQLPTYMSHILGYDISTNGLLSALPFVLRSILNFLAGVLSDWAYRRFKVSVTFLRKLFNTVSYYGTAIFIIGVTLSGCDGLLTEIILCSAMVFLGFCSAGFGCTLVDLCPELAGIILGISNTFGNIAGLLSPFVTGHLIDKNDTIAQWNKVFYIASGIFVITGTIFLVFGSSEDQNYLSSPEETSAEEGTDKGDGKKRPEMENNNKFKQGDELVTENSNITGLSYVPKYSET